MVLTIEPGLYFIDLLLERLRLDPALSRAVNWDLIAQLKPFGGIRIEDNVVVTKEGCRNLTRECGLD
jgi:Xaa-Pro dipeptidase